MTSPSTDYAQQLHAYLQAWRQYLEKTVGAMTPSQYAQPPAWGMSAVPPPAPFMPPPMPAAALGSTAAPPTDYTQQLLACLQAWRQYLEHTTCAAAPGPPDPPPVAPPPVAPPPDGPPPDAGSVRPATSATTPQDLEYLVPKQGWMSDIAFYQKPGHPEGESISGSGSLYHSGRSVLPSSPMGEYQPNSAYESARSATSGGWVSGAEQSLYSSPATPAARIQEKAVPARPEELEIVKPLIEPTK